MVLLLVRALFVFTVVGGVGVLLQAASLDAIDGELLGLLLYAALPGAAGLALSAYVRSGDIWIWRGLVAVHTWFLLGALATLGGDGDARGVPQLVIPVVGLILLLRRSSRDWFDVPVAQRVAHRPFSLARMIRWRRDRGQTATEYLGLIVIVVAIIGGLLATGIGGQLAGGMRSAICELTGSACPGPGGGEVVAGDGPESDGESGPESGTEGGAEGADSGGTGTSGGAASGGTGTGGGGASGGTSGEVSGGSSAGAAGGASAGSGGSSGDATGGTGGSSGQASGGSSGDPGAVQVGDGGDDVDDSGGADGGDPGDGDGGGDDEKGGESCTSGVGAFLSCAGHQTGGFFTGVFANGLWGDVTGTFDTVIHPVKAWNGLMDYGKSLGDTWSKDSKGAGDKWSDGDYLGAAWDWTKASGGTGLKVLDDVFIGDEVRDQWKDGNEGQAIGTGLWNIGSLFIPGYGEAKLVGKVGKLGKLGKLGEVAQKASEAAAKAKKAAKAGDVEGAEKAAADAQKHADDAADEAGLTGCTVGLGGLLRVPYADGADGGTGGTGGSGHPGARTGTGTVGVPGSGTAVMAAAHASVRVGFRTERCDEVDPEKKAAAEEAQKQADEAKKAAAEAKRKKELERARNAPKPAWYKDLKNPRAGSKDGGTGTWTKIKPGVWNYPTEMGARYQEQISKVARGKEYQVPLDKLTGKPVDFDGWDAARGTYLEAKYGYRGKDFYNAETGELTPKVQQRWAEQATRQVDAARGKPVEWHLSDPDVAEAARDLFEERGINVKVINTPGDVTG